MSDYELDLSGSISEDQFQQAIENYNGSHMNAFTLSGSDQEYSLIGGDDVYCEGDLQQVAYFWEGYVSGQGDGDTSLSVDAFDEGG